MKSLPELKKLQSTELLEELHTEKKELRRLQASHKITPLDNPMQIREKRKTIARIHTLLPKQDKSSPQQTPKAAHVEEK